MEIFYRYFVLYTYEKERKGDRKVESIQSQLIMLIEEGENFTFSNFCLPNRSGREFGGPDTPQWLTWKTRSANLIREVVSDNAAPIKMLTFGLQAKTKGNYSDKFEIAKENILSALKNTLEITKKDKFNELRGHTSKNKSAGLSNKIFVVHGHDHTLKTEIENFLHAVGLEAIVLHRKPDEGQTIIEKFEKHSDVGYAFILLTPDEIAYTVDQEKVDDKKRQKEFRARPNVIFEFGYFVGKLGRSRFAAFIKGTSHCRATWEGSFTRKL